MESLKQFITSGKTATQCGITQREIEVLRGYKTVTADGKTYETSEILNRVHSCDDCNKLKLKIKALELQLEKYAAPPVEPVQTILEDFFKSNYVRVGSRRYSRRDFFNEVVSYMRQHDIIILTPKDERYKLFLRNTVGDSSNNYKRLKINRSNI